MTSKETEIMVRLKWTACPLIFIMAATTSLGLFDSTCPAESQCLALPEGCRRDCLGTVAIKTRRRESGIIEFVVRGKGGHHTTAAISLDILMDDSFAISCVEFGNIGNVTLHRIWTGNKRQPIEIFEENSTAVIFDPETDVIDEDVTCNYEMHLPISFGGIVFNTSSDLFLLLAYGNSTDTSPLITDHKEERKASDFTIVWRGEGETERGSPEPLIIDIGGNAAIRGTIGFRQNWMNLLLLLMIYWFLLPPLAPEFFNT